MQINPIPNLDASAGSSSSKESSPAVPDSQFSFLAQMGQAWNSLMNQAIATTDENASAVASETNSDGSPVDPFAAAGRSSDGKSIEHPGGKNDASAQPPMPSMVPQSESSDWMPFAGNVDGSRKAGNAETKNGVSAIPPMPSMVSQSELSDWTPFAGNADGNRKAGNAETKNGVSAMPPMPVVVPQNESSDWTPFAGIVDDSRKTDNAVAKNCDSVPAKSTLIPDKSSFNTAIQLALAASSVKDPEQEATSPDFKKMAAQQKEISPRQGTTGAMEKESDAEGEDADLADNAIGIVTAEPNQNPDDGRLIMADLLPLNTQQASPGEMSASLAMDEDAHQPKIARTTTQKASKPVGEPPRPGVDFAAASAKTNGDQDSSGEAFSAPIPSTGKAHQKTAQANEELKPSEKISVLAENSDSADGNVKTMTVDQNQASSAEGMSVRPLDSASARLQAAKQDPEQNTSIAAAALPSSDANAQPQATITSQNSDKPQTSQDQTNKESAFGSSRKSNGIEKAKSSGVSFEEAGKEAFAQFNAVEARTSGANDVKKSDALQTPREGSSFIEQIAERMRIQVKNGGGEIQIQLKPGNLGRLEIKAETTGNGIVAQITAESEKVKSYLENNLHVLQQSFQDHGVKIDRVTIVVQNNSEYQSMTGDAGSNGYAGSGQQSKSSSKKSNNLFSKSADELTVDPSAWTAMNPNARFYTIA